MGQPSKRNFLRAIFYLLLLGGIAAGFWWWKFLRQPAELSWANESEQFKYGSIGAEFSHGMPYWIWEVLPRVFPDLLPGSGGYKSFGLVWEPGHEMPVGFTKKVIGYPRVANNCAVCHVGVWRGRQDEAPHVVVGSPANTVNYQALLRFQSKAANDSRFNSSVLLAAIQRDTKLSFIDRQIYRFILIPQTRRQLLRQERRFAWMNQTNRPDWGPGRDDPANLMKYSVGSQFADRSVCQADFPSVWNLQARKGDGQFFNWTCDATSLRSVSLDSAVALGVAPDEGNRLFHPLDKLYWRFSRRTWIEKRLQETDEFLEKLQPPKYPFPVDVDLVARGKPIFEAHCAACHQIGGARTGKPIPLGEVGTDRELFEAWTQAAADRAGDVIAKLGLEHPASVKQSGYQSPPLDGIWMRAPYLHNGSVPTLRDLLSPPSERPRTHYRGYDVFDSAAVGFVSQGPEAQRVGWKQDASTRGDGNEGHAYGTNLSQEEKNALIEYLKTF